jgi:hypothetical protein
MEETKSQQGVNKCWMKLFVADRTAGAKTRRAGLWEYWRIMVDLDGILAFGGDTSSYDEYVVGLRCVQFGSFIDTLLLMGQSGPRKSTIFGHLLNAVARANVGANSSKVVEMTSDEK